MYVLCVNTQRAFKTRLRLEVFDRLTSEAGYSNDNARAQALQMPHSTIWRVRRGQLGIGERFIAHTLAWAQRSNPHASFEDLFEVVCDDAAA